MWKSDEWKGARKDGFDAPRMLGGDLVAWGNGLERWPGVPL
jgi:hypothetical protein